MIDSKQMPVPSTKHRVAIIHPWLFEVRGGEKVFFELARLIPEADLFLLFGHTDKMPLELRQRLVGTSFLQGLRFWRYSYRSTLPLLPFAVGRLDMRKYDLVISSSSGWTHGIKTREDAVHVCYMYTPPRYLWEPDVHLPTRFSRFLGPILKLPLAFLRNWDRKAAKRVSEFIGISELVRERIRNVYGAESLVISPPADVDRFAGIRRNPGSSVLVIGELVPYKRFDLAIEACAIARRHLVIIGDGPEMQRLRSLARPNDVTFLGRVGNEEVDYQLSVAGVYLHPGIEDFGLATVEALAAGVPVVGVSTGGTAEIVGQNRVGYLADGVGAKSIANAINACFQCLPSEDACRKRATDFTAGVFTAKITAAISNRADFVHFSPDVSQAERPPEAAPTKSAVER